MKRYWLSFETTSCIVVMLLAGSSAFAQKIPKQLWGEWRISKIVPTRTIACWGDKEAKRILGTEIEYRADFFRWDNTEIAPAHAKVHEVTAQQFHDENSGGGVNDSQIDFQQLGIKAAKLTQVNIDHAKLTRATLEIPGDNVLLKSRNTIVLSVCNIYFEAKRVR